jgi:hypothetical protein
MAALNIHNEIKAKAKALHEEQTKLYSIEVYKDEHLNIKLLSGEHYKITLRHDNRVKEFNVNANSFETLAVGISKAYEKLLDNPNSILGGEEKEKVAEPPKHIETKFTPDQILNLSELYPGGKWVNGLNNYHSKSWMRVFSNKKGLTFFINTGGQLEECFNVEAWEMR